MGQWRTEAQNWIEFPHLIWILTQIYVLYRAYNSDDLMVS
jgi:hypothetical protein